MPKQDTAPSEDEQIQQPENDQEQVVAAEAGNVADAGESTDDIIDELAVRQQLDEAEKRVLQAQAELENFRKRMRREMEDERRYAAVPLIMDILAVVDNLDRAIAAAEKNDGTEGLLEGVKMVASQLATVLDKHNCKPIDAEGKEFDPHIHEAMAQFPSDEHDAGSITQVLSVGYMLHDRVVRPSQVMVSTGPAAEQSDNE